jgi:hypothetical protein
MKMHLIRQVDVKGNHGGIKGLVKRPIPGGLLVLFEKLVECPMNPGMNKEGEVDKHTHNKQSKNSIRVWC